MAQKNTPISIVPVVKAEEEEEEQELVDPQTQLREKCREGAHASALYNQFQECNDRVNSRSKTTETCTQELFDYLHEIDHCVAKTLWSKLK